METFFHTHKHLSWRQNSIWIPFSHGIVPFLCPPVLHPNRPCVTTPSTIATFFASTGAPHHDLSNDTSLAYKDVVAEKGRGVEEEVMMDSFW